MKIVVVNRPRSAFFAITVALLAILTPLFIGYSILSGARSTAAGATECTWTGAGGNNNWSTAANWTCDEGTVPEDGTALTFPYGNADQQQTTLTNDLASTNVYTGIIFTGTCIGNASYYNFYTLQGTVKVAGDVVAETPANTSDLWQCRPTFSGLEFVSNGLLDRVSGTSLTIGAYDVTIATYTNINDLVGSGDILAQGRVWLEGDTTAFTGTLAVTDGALWGYSFGASSVPITIGSGGQLSYGQAGTYANPITVLSGASTPTLTSATQSGDTLEVDAVYAKNCDATSCGAIITQPTTFSGAITLNQELSVEAPIGGLTLSGALTGNGHGVVLYNPDVADDGSTGSLILNASPNNSTTANGTFSPTYHVTTLGDTTSATLFVGAMNKVIVNGQRGNITLNNNGIISGSGTVGAISAQWAGIIQPGTSPGVLSSGDVTLTSDAQLDIELGGTATGDFDQLNVAGTVSLGGAALNVSHWDTYIPVNGDSFVIINNDSTDAVTGTFAGLTEGAEVEVDGVTYTISYVGGTGNDVVLTTLDSPGPPNTAGVFGKPMSLLLPAGIITTAGLALLLRSQFKRLRFVAVRNK